MAVSMQFPFGTIVVAMDFSENSSATLRYVQAMARLVWCEGSSRARDRSHWLCISCSNATLNFLRSGA